MGLLYDNSLTAFVLITLVLGGGAAWLTGRAVAISWQPLWRAFAYMIPLAAATRFLHYALAGGALTTLQYFLVSFVILAALTSLAYRMTRAWQMTNQYPWLYRRSSPLSWTERPGSEASGT